MKTYRLLVGLGVVVIVILAVVIGTTFTRGSFSLKEYDIFVDPFKDPQDLFTMARITIQNTGKQPLTNVRVNFGGGDFQNLGTLIPGQKILISPPSDNEMKFVTITSDEGIFVSKAYRFPTKMPGMMGS